MNLFDEMAAHEVKAQQPHYNVCIYRDSPGGRTRGALCGVAYNKSTLRDAARRLTQHGMSISMFEVGKVSV